MASHSSGDFSAASSWMSAPANAPSVFLVDVQPRHEQAANGDGLGLLLLAGFLDGHQVDFPAGELGRQAHVLAAPADGNGEVFLVDHHIHAVLFLVDDDRRHRGRCQGTDHELRRIGRPDDDVDAFACQFVGDGLHARAAHADAGADRVDRRIPRNNSDFRTRAGVARDRLDLDDAVVDFRHFLREQLGQEAGMGAGEEDLRAPRLLPHVIDEGANAIAVAERFAWNHLVAAHYTFGAAQIHHHRLQVKGCEKEMKGAPLD